MGIIFHYLYREKLLPSTFLRFHALLVSEE